MRLLVAGCLFVVIVSTVLADTEETTDNKPDEEEYEDIAVAESQDIGHSRLHPNNNSDDVFDRPRSRPRGRKRRRRLRKRPRSSTPSFIEEYNPERKVKDEEAPLGEEDVIYQRRRPSKRRRRPNRRKPEYESENAELDAPREFNDDRLPQEYYRSRNPQRRRRKGSRKRIRVTTESISGLTNNTHDNVLPESTTQSTEVVVQSNNFKQYHGSIIDASLANNQDETVSSTFPSAFTPKEITEINHKLESISSYQEPSENDYQVSGLGAFSIYQPSSIHSTTENHEENHIISSSTTKDYRWINRFDPRVAAGTTENSATTTTTFETTTQKLVSEKKPQQNIKNIEKIIENRKNLFATSRRLSPTSALIRRRLRPRKHRNSTTTQETITDNTIATINTTNSHKENECQSVECALNKTSILANNIIPSALLPSGFPTMPEIISTAELIQNMSLKLKKNEHSTPQPEPTETEVPKQANNNNFIIITPSTLIRSPNGGENVIPQVQISELRTLSEISEQALTTFTAATDAQTDISTHTDVDTDKQVPTELTFKEVETKPEETTTSSSTESTPTVTTLKAIEEIITHTTITSLENENNTRIGNISSESDKLKLDGIDVSNINDEILELIMDEMGKARVKRILELRNMTLSELIAHRERGAGHFSSFINQSETTNYTTENSADQQKAGTGEVKTEEETEKIIVEKAKHFLNEYKKSDNSFLSVIKSSQRNNEKFEKKLKVEGTVIPVPILEPTHVSTIQFPEEKVLGDFPKYIYDIAGKKLSSKEKPLVFTETINTPKDIQQFNDKREPRVFDSMPKFNSEISNKEGLEISPYPDWRITVSKSTEKNSGFPGISKEIMLVATSTRKPENLEDVILLDEGEEVHHLRNHILGGNINVESSDITDSDYPDEKKVPAGVKSAIAASGALLGLAIFGFLAVLVSCKIRQRRARLRARRDILCEHLAEDIRSSQRSLTPVLMKSPFNHGIHSNTASNRHYYLWRTLRKTFQYE